MQYEGVAAHIEQSSSCLDVRNCVFSHLNSPSGGGAIRAYATGLETIIGYCTFEVCSSSVSHGGALSIANDLDVHRCCGYSCYSVERGQFADVLQGSSTRAVIFAYTSLVSCQPPDSLTSAYPLGTIAISQTYREEFKNVNLSSCAFTNSADEYADLGAALYLRSGGDLAAIHVTIEKCVARSIVDSFRTGGSAGYFERTNFFQNTVELTAPGDTGLFCVVSHGFDLMHCTFIDNPVSVLFEQVYTKAFAFTNCLFSGALPAGEGMTFMNCSANVAAATTIPLPMLNTRLCPVAVEVPEPTTTPGQTASTSPTSSHSAGPSDPFTIDSRVPYRKGFFLLRTGYVLIAFTPWD
jgi:hypothetical protein